MLWRGVGVWPTQVLAVRDKRRLWTLDAWLLAEVSHYYLPFADAYLAHMLDELRKLLRRELDQKQAGSSDFSRQEITERTRTLSSRSSRLKTLCSVAIAQISIIAPSMESMFPCDGLL